MSAPTPSLKALQLGEGSLWWADCLEVMQTMPDSSVQAVIADPPYFQVNLDAEWDNAWANSNEWLTWCLQWITEALRIVKEDGLIYIFGQLGKREHVWLHLCSEAAKVGQFHDMVIWDRAVGYNDRADSFTPQYEMALVLRKSENSKVYFDKDAVRIPYDEATIQMYLKDKRYKDMAARETYLRKGKKATNILRVPSLKGASSEKVGHPTQKPEALIEMLILSSTRPGDTVLDPFVGSGTTAAVAQRTGRKWIGIEASKDYVDIANRRINEVIASK